jgi:uncharacterized protein YjbI with pentapeptide repeats
MAVRPRQQRAERVKAPLLPVELEERQLTLSDIARGTHVREALVEGAELADLDAEAVAFEDIRMNSIDLSAAALLRGGFMDAEIERSNLSNLTLPGGSMIRTRVTHSRMTGFQMVDALLRDVTFQDCRIDLSSFRASKLHRVAFRNCLLQNADFSQAELKSVVFEHCDLGGSEFSNARCDRTEFHACELLTVKGVPGLKGSLMPWHDMVPLAGVLAAALGIAVIEEEN